MKKKPKRQKKSILNINKNFLPMHNKLTNQKNSIQIYKKKIKNEIKLKNNFNTISLSQGLTIEIQVLIYNI